MTNLYTTSTTDSSAFKKMLCGRVDDLCKVVEYIAVGKSIALFGEQRIGKTSFLFLFRDILNGHINQYADNLIDVTLKQSLAELRAKLPSDCKVIYISLQNLSLSDATVFAKELFRALYDEGLLHSPPEKVNFISMQPASPPEEATITDVLRQLHESLGERRCVILFDEMEVLLTFANSRQIAWNFRSAIHSYPNICMVFAGTEEWHNQIKDKTSPLANNVFPFFLKNPSQFPVETYLVKGLLEQSFPPSSAIANMTQTIMLWTECKIIYVQAICSSIMEKYSATGQIPGNWQAEIEEKVFEDMRPILRNFYMGSNLDPLTKSIIALLANKPNLTVKGIARKLGYSTKVINDKMSDLVSLAKVSQHGKKYRLVGKIIETWGKRNLDTPSIKPSWPGPLKWGAALIFFSLAFFAYFYTHPGTQTFSYTVPDAIISVQVPESLEQGETGTAQVTVQNTNPQTSTTIHVFLRSSTISYQLSGTDQLTFQELAPGETKFVEPTYTVDNAGSFASTPLITQVIITEGNSTSQTIHTFAVSERFLPFQKFWLPISLLLGAFGTFIKSKDIWQLLVNLFGFLQGRGTSS
jgi:hypothetical protein